MKQYFPWGICWKPSVVNFNIEAVWFDNSCNQQETDQKNVKGNAVQLKALKLSWESRKFAYICRAVSVSKKNLRSL